MVPITVTLTIQPLPGYTTTTANAIIQAIAAYISALPIGGDVFLTQIFQPIYGLPTVGGTFNVTQLLISRTGSPSSADIILAFNEAAVSTVDNISITVLVH